MHEKTVSYAGSFFVCISRVTTSKQLELLTSENRRRAGYRERPTGTNDPSGRHHKSTSVFVVVITPKKQVASVLVSLGAQRTKVLRTLGTILPVVSQHTVVSKRTCKEFCITSMVRLKKYTLLLYYQHMFHEYLHLYLASDLAVSDYIDLGPVRGVHGNINYPLPEDIDLARYPYVLHGGFLFGVLFSYVELKK